MNGISLTKRRSALSLAKGLASPSTHLRLRGFVPLVGCTVDRKPTSMYISTVVHIQPTDEFSRATHQVLVSALSALADKEANNDLAGNEFLDVKDTLRIIGSVEDLYPWYVEGRARTHVRGNALVGFRARLAVVEAYPQLSIRALEQGQFDIVFHGANSSIRPEKKTRQKYWRCPHCLDEFVGQPAILEQHFVENNNPKCKELIALEAKIAEANVDTNNAP